MSVEDSEPWGSREALHMVVTPGHFETLGIDLKVGRPLQVSDGADDPLVVVVDEALAARLARDGAVLGRELDVTRHTFDGRYQIERARAEVVGVVATVPHAHPGVSPPGTLYFPLAQYPLWSLAVAVRGEDRVVPPARIAREALAQVDPALPAVDVASMRDVAGRTLAPTRFVTALIGALGLLVVALTVAGLYGVVAETVRDRQRELGVRLALGATAGAITRRVLLGALLLAGLGVVPACLVVPGVGARLRAALGFVPSVDGLALALAALLVLAVTASASWVPARRAGRIDPARVLRAE